MILTGDFFHVLDRFPTEGGFSTSVRLNPDHVVYTGHFPGFPVTPGVIQLQIVHELLESHLGRRIKLKIMPQCKFLNLLNPMDTPQLTVDIGFSDKDGWIHSTAQGVFNGTVFFKFTAVYEPET